MDKWGARVEPHTNNLRTKRSGNQERKDQGETRDRVEKLERKTDNQKKKTAGDIWTRKGTVTRKESWGEELELSRTSTE